MFQHAKSFIEVQLINHFDIFEDNHNIVPDLFEKDSVNVMKSWPLVAKNHKEISVYINLTQSHQKTMEIVTRNNNTQNVRKPYRFRANC